MTSCKAEDTDCLSQDMGLNNPSNIRTHKLGMLHDDTQQGDPSGCYMKDRASVHQLVLKIVDIVPFTHLQVVSVRNLDTNGL